MDARLALALSLGKGAGIATRLLRRGGGTALPGLVATRVEPDIVTKLRRQLLGGRILVTGTNGKTTTSRILAAILDAAAAPFLHNREGSNLMRGFASTLLEVSGATGRLRLPFEALGLFETDEATMPAAVRAFAPSAMAFTNLFRDQLDRYGEVDTVAAMWREALAVAPKDGTLVLNADDPSVAELAVDWTGPVHWYGIDDASFSTETRGAFDARWCRSCGGTFAYSRRYFAHVGFWRCDDCGRARPEPDTVARDIHLGIDSCTFTVDGLGELSMPLTGLYNVSNALAAIAVARVLRLPDAAIVQGVRQVQPAFGRQEVIDHHGLRLRLLLCKNPAGANEVLRLLASIQSPDGLNAAVLLSDRFADGQDVSWIWDVDYELIGKTVATCWCGGTRAEDIALRLKYAGWPVPTVVTRDMSALLREIVLNSATGSDVFVIATYTAMLDLRQALGLKVRDEG